MGRQSAGAGFLRAAVAASQGQTIWGYTPNPQSAEVFQRLVREIDASADPKWLAAHRLDLLGQIGPCICRCPAWPTRPACDCARGRPLIHSSA